MIYLTKGKPLVDNPGMVVFDSTGYYNDGDSVICASASFPEEPVCRFEAKYIAYGGMVYSVSNPEELMAEILKLDPVSLFGKDSQEIAVDKMVEKIIPQESGEITKEATISEVVNPVDNPEINIDPPIDPDPLIEIGDGDAILDSLNGTTTPESIIPDNNISNNVSTTSPEILFNDLPQDIPIVEQSIGTSTDSIL